jgi:hypothetical protein
VWFVSSREPTLEDLLRIFHYSFCRGISQILPGFGDLEIWVEKF